LIQFGLLTVNRNELGHREHRRLRIWFDDHLANLGRIAGHRGVGLDLRFFDPDGILMPSFNMAADAIVVGNRNEGLGRNRC